MQRLKTGMCIGERSQTVHAILTHLAECPEAQDTLEGITEWWLLEQRIKVTSIEVKEAITDLLNRGLILEKKGRDARSRYRVNKRRSRAIAKLLQEQCKDG